MPAGANNYYIRSLLGPRFFETPLLAISPAYVHQAMLEVRDACRLLGVHVTGLELMAFSSLV